MGVSEYKLKKKKKAFGWEVIVCDLVKMSPWPGFNISSKRGAILMEKMTSHTSGVQNMCDSHVPGIILAGCHTCMQEKLKTFSILRNIRRI